VVTGGENLRGAERSCKECESSEGSERRAQGKKHNLKRKGRRSQVLSEIKKREECYSDRGRQKREPVEEESHRPAIEKRKGERTGYREKRVLQASVREARPVGKSHKREKGPHFGTVKRKNPVVEPVHTTLRERGDKKWGHSSSEKGETDWR